MTHDKPSSNIPFDERISVRPREVAEMTGISTTRIYRAIESGELPARKLGSSLIITPSDVHRWIASGVSTQTPVD